MTKAHKEQDPKALKERRVLLAQLDLRVRRALKAQLGLRVRRALKAQLDLRVLGQLADPILNFFTITVAHRQEQLD